MIEFIKEFWEFLRVRKKYWLLPIIVVLALFGVLIGLYISKFISGEKLKKIFGYFVLSIAVFIFLKELY